MRHAVAAHSPPFSIATVASRALLKASAVVPHMIGMTLEGITVVFSRDIAELDARTRGRLLYRITMMDAEEGEFVFAGFLINWRICTFAGKRVLDIYMGSE